jgi:putative membrane protein
MNTTLMRAMIGMSIFLIVGAARAGDPPSAAGVLAKLHNSNLTDIEAGKLAQDNGHSKATKDYGKLLVTDQTSADEQVKALAKQEEVDLSASTPVVGTNHLADLTAGPAFDRRFARWAVDHQKKKIAEVAAARDYTTDAKLKALLTSMLPTLEKHERLAESLASGR